MEICIYPLNPRPKVSIVTCMDSRLHVAPALGLALGDAHILRNAGGRVTEDMIRSLVISQQQMGTREIVVLHHTDCGAQTFNNEDFQEHLKCELGLMYLGRTFTISKTSKRVFERIWNCFENAHWFQMMLLFQELFTMWIQVVWGEKHTNFVFKKLHR